MAPKKIGVKHFIVARHSEKPSAVWCEEWFDMATETGRYTAFDANMVGGSDHWAPNRTAFLMGAALQPGRLPIPGRILAEYVSDEPLTNFGVHLAEQLGVSLDRAKLVPDAVYSSPALRCLLTALAATAPTKLINVTPALYEPFWPFPTLIARAFLGPTRLQHNGFNIDHSYDPVYKQLVGHAATLDDAYSKLVGGKVKPYSPRGVYIGRFEEEPNFCQVVMFRREKDKWLYVEDAVQPYTTASFTNRGELHQ